VIILTFEDSKHIHVYLFYIYFNCHYKKRSKNWKVKGDVAHNLYKRLDVNCQIQKTLVDDVGT